MFFFFRQKSKHPLTTIIILHVTMFDTELHRPLHRIHYLPIPVLPEIIHDRIVITIILIGSDKTLDTKLSITLLLITTLSGFLFYYSTYQ